MAIQPQPSTVRTLFPLYDAMHMEVISYAYFTNELTRYKQPDSRFRPCVNGVSGSLLVGCVCTRIVGGLGVPLPEFAFWAEYVAGFVDTPVARECVMCMIAAVKIRTMRYNMELLDFNYETHTLQPFRVLLATSIFCKKAYLLFFLVSYCPILD